jgi:hypothetical protein
MLLNELSSDILLELSKYLLEPQIYITNIKWNKDNKYVIEYNKIEFNKKLNYYIHILQYQINYYNIYNIYDLYEIIYNYNKSFRKFNPTYIFIDNIFIKYKYLPLSKYINKEYNSELNIIKLQKELEVMHYKYIKKHYNLILKELLYFINKYKKFTKRYILENNDLININYYFIYPFYMYILDVLPFYY